MMKLQTHLHPVDNAHPQHQHLWVWIPVPAWRQLLRPITMGRSTSAALTSAVPGTCCVAAAAPRARITSSFNGFTPLTGTCASKTAILQAPTACAIVSEASDTLVASPNASAEGGPETPAAAPESSATTTPTSGETMLPGERHECQDNDGEAVFMEPPAGAKAARL